jgi:SAM-dependent methyltransferase
MPKYLQFRHFVKIAGRPFPVDSVTGPRINFQRMQEHDFESLYHLEESYWWFAGMRDVADTIMARELQQPNLRLLDAGCGTGYNLGHYAGEGRRQVYGLDIDADALRYVRKRGFTKVAQASVAEIPFESETFDLVCSFDVVVMTPLEMHDACLSEMRRVLKPGGHLFIRVAALMWLWSSHDEDLGVRYRYTREELSKRLAAHGFTVEWASYANGFLFPIIVARRFLKRFGVGGGSDVKPLPRGLRWLDGIFRTALSGEAKWFKAGHRLPVGLSVICYARKI